MPTIVLPVLTYEVIEGAANKVMRVNCSRPNFVVEDITQKRSPVPIMLHSAITCNITYPEVEPLTSTSGKMRESALYQVVNWLCIDDCCGTFTSWYLSGDWGTIDWQLSNAFAYKSTAALFPILLPNHPTTEITDIHRQELRLSYAGIDAIFIPHHCDILSECIF